LRKGCRSKGVGQTTSFKPKTPTGSGHSRFHQSLFWCI